MYCRLVDVCIEGACEGRTWLWLCLWLALLLAPGFMTLPTWQHIMATLSNLYIAQGIMSKQMRAIESSELINKISLFFFFFFGYKKMKLRWDVFCFGQVTCLDELMETEGKICVWWLYFYEQNKVYISNYCAKEFFFSHTMHFVKVASSNLKKSTNPDQ